TWQALQPMQTVVSVKKPTGSAMVIVLWRLRPRAKRKRGAVMLPRAVARGTPNLHHNQGAAHAGSPHGHLSLALGRNPARRLPRRRPDHRQLRRRPPRPPGAAGPAARTGGIASRPRGSPDPGPTPPPAPAAGALPTPPDHPGRPGRPAA